MAVLEIEGRRVEVDDSFLDLSPEAQAATVDEIAGQLGVQPAAPPETPVGVVDSVSNALSRRKRDELAAAQVFNAEQQAAAAQDLRGDTPDAIVYGRDRLAFGEKVGLPMLPDDPISMAFRGIRALQASATGGADAAEVRAAQSLGEAQRLAVERQQFPQSRRGGAATQRIGQAETISDVFSAIAEDPAGTAMGVAEIGAEEIPALLAAALVPGGPVAKLGTNTALGVNRERFGQAVQLAQEQGVDLSDPEQALAVVRDPAFLEEQARRGSARALPIAALDAIGARVAMNKLLPNRLGDFAAQTGVQMTTAGTGEALAQIGATGEIESVGEIALETLAEGLQTGPEVLGLARNFGQKYGKDAPTLRDAVDAAADGDADAERLVFEVADALGLSPEEVVATMTPGMQERALEAVAARRVEEEARSKFPDTDQAQLREQTAAVENGEMDPAAMSNVGREPRVVPDTVPVTPDGQGMVGTGAEGARQDQVRQMRPGLPAVVEDVANPQANRMTPAEIARAQRQNAAAPRGNRNAATDDVIIPSAGRATRSPMPAAEAARRAELRARSGQAPVTPSGPDFRTEDNGVGQDPNAGPTSPRTPPMTRAPRQLPTDAELDATGARVPFESAAVGTSDRPFRAEPREGGLSPRQREYFRSLGLTDEQINGAYPEAGQDQFFEERARAQAEAERQRGVDEMEAEWERRRQQERSRRAENDRARNRTNQRYDDSAFTEDPGDANPETGFWGVTDDGFLRASDGKIVRFRSKRDAAKWAVKNNMGGYFDMVAARANTDEVLLRARDGYADASSQGRARREAEANQRSAEEAFEAQPENPNPPVASPRRLAGPEPRANARPEATTAETDGQTSQAEAQDAPEPDFGPPQDIPPRRVMDKIRAMGGIRVRDANGKLTPIASDLYAMGVKPGAKGTPPGLFNNKGGGIDNIPVDDMPELRGAVPVADDGTYFDPNAIAEALANEMSGQPTMTLDEQVETRARAESERAYERMMEEAGFNTEFTPEGEQTVIPGAEKISPREQAERAQRGAKKATKPQREPGADGGLFDEDAQNQTDFADEWGNIPFSNPAFNPDLWRWYGKRIGRLTNQATSAVAKLLGTTSLTKSGAKAAMAKMFRAATSPLRVARHGWNVALATYDGRLRDLNADHKSKTLTEVLDMLWSRSGSESTRRGMTVEERLTSHVHSSLAKAGRIMAGFDAKTKSKIVNAIRAGALRSLSAKERAAADQLKRWFRDQLAYLRDAGVDIGEVRNNFFPREFDIGRLKDDETLFVRNAAALYRDGDPTLSRRQSEEMAQALFDTITTEGPTDIIGRDPSTRASFFKGRVFGPKADLPTKQGGLQEFMLDDFEYIVSRYVTRAAKRAEVARAFGDQFSEWDAKFGRPMREEGVPGDTRALLIDYIHHVLGLQHASGWRAWSFLQTVGTLSFLEFATITSLPEILTPALRTGNLGDAVRLLGQSAEDLARMVLRLKPRDQQLAARELAEDIGAVAGDAIMSFQLARFMGTDQLNRAQAHILGSYFQTIGLHQFTDYTGTQAVATGVRFLRRLAKATKGESFFMTPDFARDALSEFGIKGGDVDLFADYVLSVAPDGKVPPPSQLGGDMGALFKAALFRMADQSRMRPTAAIKPQWASKNAFGRLVFSLQSFGYAFAKNVLSRQAKNTMKAGSAAKRALTKGDAGAAKDAAMYLFPVLMTATIMPVAQLILGAGRDELDEFLSGRDKKPMTFWAEVERAISRSGLTGAADPYIQMLSGTRYNRSTAQALAGPSLGALFDVSDATSAFALNNSPNTSSAERRLFEQSWELGLEPLTAAAIAFNIAKTPFTFVGWAAIAGVRGRKEAAADAIAPVRPTSRDVRPSRGLLDGRESPRLTAEQEGDLRLRQAQWDLRHMDLIIERQIAKRLRELEGF